jgi:hypothetical protein
VKLIDNWKQAWRMFSVQAMAAALMLQAVWPEIPPEIKAELPANLVHWVTVGTVLLGIVLRVVRQPAVTPPPPPPGGGAP